MVVSLKGPRRWLFAGIVFCLLAGYLFFASKEFLASVFAGRDDATSLARAIRLAPGNAQYPAQLAGHFINSDPQSSLALFRAAVRLNPHRARYWLDLAATYNALDNSSGQRDSIDHALAAEPTDPRVAWEAA